jgi:hypothetical protein
MTYELIFQDCTNEELIKIITILDELMELDEHLFETSPYLRKPYESFKFHNRMIRSLAHTYLNDMSYEERVQYNYPNLKKKRTESE